MINVVARCNGQTIKTRRLLTDAVRKWAWMTEFESARLLIPADAETIGNRQLHVANLDQPAVVHVVDGRITVTRR